MKIIGKKQVPNIVVYAVLYAIIFGTGIWLTIYHIDAVSDGIMYSAMGTAVLAGIVKSAIELNKSRQSTC